MASMSPFKGSGFSFRYFNQLALVVVCRNTGLEAMRKNPYFAYREIPEFCQMARRGAGDGKTRPAPLAGRGAEYAGRSSDFKC